MSMKYSSIPTAQSIVQHCRAKNISNIVISPGSRNAPLTISFTEDPFFTCFSIVDERCAGFFALGMAQQLQQPVVVLCTSGSALLNYYPAVAEAFYSTIPLVVISADRPYYKVGIGDGQTIHQKNIYANQIGYSANLKQDVSHSSEVIKQYAPSWISDNHIERSQSKVQHYNDVELNNALTFALNELCPVHINVPFEEPLYQTQLQPSISANIPDLAEPKTNTPTLDNKRKIWNSTAKKMVLVGVSAPSTLNEAMINALANDPSVIVFTETTSNLNHPNFFNSIDSIIAPIEMGEQPQEGFRKLQPEILVTFGGLIVSKKIKAFLRKYKPKHHWHVGSINANNTFFCLEEHIKVSVDYFFQEMYTDIKASGSSYFTEWHMVKENYKLKRATYLAQIPFSDFYAFNSILNAIPKGYLLQLANSSTIRYTQLFEIDASINVNCNRGTSGIDGSTSTAIGASVVNANPTLFITGDLSFFYDSNALWNNYTKNNFRIIVINNQGGGIFRILPGQKESESFKTFFETRHNLSAKHLCKMFNIEHNKANSKDSLNEMIPLFFSESDRPKLLEIETPALINDKILIDYFRFIS
ncbi:2-succinyl-5-enolpyruvyl-6-hydroxy-3-cyclohexene-1-carboxylate synthase [Maribacter sedimenticola]|uniref:2-succinyl-5-enolpyruvyl-6-hydroxy-3-cyclohexene-1-carboxylate synthase n=2 Tax=Maribacter sedimenticola TaxID=228956 RepID=A0ABY1SJS6_9FLAO|nr:2-succinyl-5-enolpyruvyl-6-hydroxy-3-cyclohexene-1-carboxylate synthase [Maribacter sedimenticola]